MAPAAAAAAAASDHEKSQPAAAWFSRAKPAFLLCPTAEAGRERLVVAADLMMALSPAEDTQAAHTVPTHTLHIFQNRIIWRGLYPSITSPWLASTHMGGSGGGGILLLPRSMHRFFFGRGRRSRSHIQDCLDDWLLSQRASLVSGMPHILNGRRGGGSKGGGGGGEIPCNGL